MKLTELTSRYVAIKQAAGMRYSNEAGVLSAFCRFIGDVDIVEVTSEQVLDFLTGRGPITRAWHYKYQVINGFYRFAIARGCVIASPLPVTRPKPPPHRRPFLYTQEQLKRLLAATDTLARRLCCNKFRRA